MYTLRLFGGFAVFDAAAEPVPGLANQRAEAVLATLALCGDVGCARDRLIALLWPESGDALARHNLRNALYALRHKLDADVVSNVGTRIRLNPAEMVSDVEEFARAVAAKRMEAAVTLYRGALLEGFHVDDAPEFEHWVEEQRQRLHRECADALETLARQADGVSGPHGGVAWWTRMAEHEPHNSRVAIKLMRALSAAGDRATALRVAESHRRRLAEDLEIEPGEPFEAEVARLRAEHAGTPAAHR